MKILSIWEILCISTNSCIVPQRNARFLVKNTLKHNQIMPSLAAGEFLLKNYFLLLIKPQYYSGTKWTCPLDARFSSSAKGWWQVWASPGNILFSLARSASKKSIEQWMWGDSCCGASKEIGKINAWEPFYSGFSMFWLRMWNVVSKKALSNPMLKILFLSFILKVS